MKVLVDNQLPPALARMLASEFDVDAAHVVDVGLCEASDVTIWEYAANTHCVLITKDLDFARMALHRTECALVWVRLAFCPETRTR